METYNKVLLLSDVPFQDLARRTHNVITTYAERSIQIPGGIEPYNPEDLETCVILKVFPFAD